MCIRVTCQSCQRPTYAGCGMHIEEVLGDVPRDQRCQCREERAGSASPLLPGAGLLERIFGRN